MSRIKSPNCVDRMNAAERIGDTIKALEAGTFGKAQTESKHTAGPWATDGAYITAENGTYLIAEMPDADLESDDAVVRANANLLAAAPEMFDALLAVEKRYLPTPMILVRAALGKAGASL